MLFIGKDLGARLHIEMIHIIYEWGFVVIHRCYPFYHEQSTIHRPIAFIAGGLALGILLSLFKNDFGELFRALGLGLIFFLQRSELGKAMPAALLFMLVCTDFVFQNNLQFIAPLFADTSHDDK